jgi:hypothetical protein
MVLQPSPASTASSLPDRVSRLDLTANYYQNHNMASGSQIAWLAGLSTSFDPPTGEQKFLRKVSCDDGERADTVD